MADEAAFPSRSERRLLAVSALLVASLPGAVWWLIGDSFDEAGGVDYIFRLPELHPAVGVGSVVLTLASGCGLFISRGSRLWRRGWARVLSRLLLAGLLLAVGGRIATARVGGANIGGGMVTMVGPLVILYLLARSRQEWVEVKADDGAVGWMPSATEWLARGGHCRNGHPGRVVLGFVLLLVLPALGLALLLWCPLLRLAGRRRSIWETQQSAWSAKWPQR